MGPGVAPSRAVREIHAAERINRALLGGANPIDRRRAWRCFQHPSIVNYISGAYFLYLVLRELSLAGMVRGWQQLNQ
jgi:hypothetical protein